MIEQAVSKRNRTREKKLILLFRIIMVIAIALLLAGEILGITLASVYWQGNQDVFWQWVLVLLFFGLPIAALCLLLQYLINRYRVEYDYVYQNESFSCYRITGQRRKSYLFFKLSDISAYIRYDEIEPNSREARWLQNAVLICCNPKSDRLRLLYINNCQVGKKYKDCAVLIEPNAALAALCAVHSRTCVFCGLSLCAHVWLVYGV